MSGQPRLVPSAPAPPPPHLGSRPASHFSTPQEHPRPHWRPVPGKASAVGRPNTGHTQTAPSVHSPPCPPSSAPKIPPSFSTVPDACLPPESTDNPSPPTSRTVQRSTPTLPGKGDCNTYLLSNGGPPLPVTGQPRPKARQEKAGGNLNQRGPPPLLKLVFLRAYSLQVSPMLLF